MFSAEICLDDQLCHAFVPGNLFASFCIFFSSNQHKYYNVPCIKWKTFCFRLRTCKRKFEKPIKYSFYTVISFSYALSLQLYIIDALFRKFIVIPNLLLSLMHYLIGILFFFFFPLGSCITGIGWILRQKTE